MTDETFKDALASLEGIASLELTDEQRKTLRPLCAQIAGEGFVPSWRLKKEAENRRAAEEPLKVLEHRLSQLEAALKESRKEWCFRRGKSESDTRAKASRAS